MGSLGKRFAALRQEFGTYMQERRGKAPPPSEDGGNTADALMMCGSVAVLLYFSMELYRLYAYLYFSSGLPTLAELHGGGGM